MKKLIMLLIGLLININLALASTKLNDKIAVIVNNDIILESEINNYVKALKVAQYNTDINLLNDEKLRDQAVQKKIIEKILFQLGEQIGLNITNEKLDVIIKKISDMNNIDINQFRKQLTNKGISYQTYREQIIAQIIISIIRSKELINKIVIYPQEINRLAKQVILDKLNESKVKFSQITLPLSENPSKQQLYKKKKLAENIIIKLKKGQNLNTLRKKYLLKIKNIDWTKIKNTPSVFNKLIINSKKGDILGPIHSGIGFNILKINEFLIHDNNQNTKFSKMKLRFFPLKSYYKKVDYEKKFNALKHIISEFNNKKIDFKIMTTKFNNNLFSINQNYVKLIVFNQNSKQNNYNMLLKLKNNQISQPVKLNSIWYIIQKLNTYKTNKNDIIQKKEALINIINTKLNEEFKYWIKQRIANSYIKIIKNEATH
ncbi:hypothetical protein CRV09_01930 [Candidatus Pantoea edessiphila]|uniref:SurA N-terminal domain-containing protein n=1 Tax=Candidatus Pantoea edessiphila TaxID=2044610 RepID=A0A2P5T265_9GAMM|nr:hypothetical protein CRV09_01930 [Candidatus Pantoea edessiphila]